jgi:hypothetical protein
LVVAYVMMRDSKQKGVRARILAYPIIDIYKKWLGVGIG